MHKFALYADKAATKLLEIITAASFSDATQYAYRKYGGECRNIKQIS